MSEHASPTAATGDPVTLETGLEAFRSSPEFHGPVEDLDGHNCNDHFAQIYERPAEKFEAAIPFVRHGLDQGEQIAYVVDQSTETEVRTALQDAGIDVEAALDSGALTFYTVDETYLQNGSFDPDEMIQFYADAAAEATEDFEALRLVAEMSWMEADDTTVEQLMKYESKINDLFDTEDVLAICQYDRDLFTPEVINNIVRTHPHLIYDGAACHNFYYTPPEELFGEDDLARENERMLRTLHDRTEAKTELKQRDRFLQNLYHISAESTSFEEKLDALFDLGREQFGLDIGGIAKIDPKTDYFEVEAVSGDHDHLVAGAQYPLSETYCRLATDNSETVAVTDPVDARFEGQLCYDQFEVQTYLGTHVAVDGEMDRTFWFLSTEPRETPVSDEEHTFVDLMGQWVGYELERRERERELRERTEHLRALVETTPECIKTVAPDGTLLQMNSAGLEMVEAPEEAAVTGECIYDLIAPEDRERFREFNERVCNGEREILEFDIIGLDGTRRHMESHAAPLERPDGETVHVALTRDVTEQKKREAELRQTKTRFETVFEQSNDAILLVDPDADAFVDVNPAAAEMLRYTRDELSSLRPSDTHPDELEQFHAFLEEVLETGSAWSEELHCRTKDGQDLSTEVSASAITLDGRDLVLANVRHIEERKKHERYQRELYDIVADLQASFDEKLDSLLELGRERFGLENAYFNEVGDDAVEVVDAIGPHDLIEPGESARLDGTYCEKLLASSGQLAVSDAAEIGWTDDRAYETYGLDTYLATTVRVSTDVHGLLCFSSEAPRGNPFTKAERAFLDLMGQCVSYELERNHREAQLEQKNDRLESFASMLAHELRNPTMIGQMYCHELPEDAAPEAVGYITESLDRIEDMIDVLLLLTRGREAVDECTPVDPADVAREAWETVETLDATLDVDLDRTIRIDETYVRHLFRNLLENAVEHGGGDVTVTVGDLDDGFYVADDGVGIPPEDRNTVFDEGYTTAADNGGTGLGLAFVQKLAEVYDWDVTVTESEAGGARFEFRNVT
ncbi:MEDS domain-containing protein [Halomicrococcus sp. NG-SE-24]|uniref:MEDS domain-containing protein n=1 Tax=Halomicrococcus sp. NG-SE-24 TaxID=3436928 RepID=UPI003D9A0272